MKINQKVLSIPPFISTSWKNISMLQINENAGTKDLLIILNNGSRIQIPNLPGVVIEEIFDAHSKFLEQDEAVQKKPVKQTSENPPANSNFSFGIPLNFGSGSIENMATIMQHNSEQKNAPDLPPEVIDKITSISKMVGIDGELESLPKAEPHCNCFYCQIARSLNQGEEEFEESEEEEVVSDEDLTFKDWGIKQTGDKLYTVTHPLNINEQYQVYLGNPIGCTCGEKNCIHIRTVLNS